MKKILTTAALTLPIIVFAAGAKDNGLKSSDVKKVPLNFTYADEALNISISDDDVRLQQRNSAVEVEKPVVNIKDGKITSIDFYQDKNYSESSEVATEFKKDISSGSRYSGYTSSFSYELYNYDSMSQYSQLDFSLTYNDKKYICSSLDVGIFFTHGKSFPMGRDIAHTQYMLGSADGNADMDTQKASLPCKSEDKDSLNLGLYVTNKGVKVSILQNDKL